MPVQAMCTRCRQRFAYPDGTRPEEMICPTCGVPMEMRGQVAPPRGSNGLAVTALVTGILSVTCLSVLAGIPALICGFMALSQMKQRPGEEGKGLAIAGIVLGFMSVAMAVLAALAMTLMVSGPLRVARSHARGSACLSNLTQIGFAVSMYEAQNGARPYDARGPMYSLSLLYPSYLSDPSDFRCPGVTAASGRTFPADCSLAGERCDYEYVQTSATATAPAATLPILRDYPGNHPVTGVNVLYADGHVEYGGSRGGHVRTVRSGRPPAPVLVPLQPAPAAPTP